MDKAGIICEWKNLERPERRLVLSGNKESGGRICAFSPDGQWIATANKYNTLRLWSFETGEMVTEVELNQYKVRDLVFTPDSSRLLTIGFDGREGFEWLKFWGVRDLRLIHTFESSRIAKQFTTLDISSDGRWLVTGEFGTVRIWDLEQQRHLRAFSLFGGRVESVRFDPAGTRFIAAGAGTVKIHDWQRGRTDLTVRHPGLTTASGFDNTGEHFITQGETRVPQLWRMPKEEAMISLDISQSFIASPDGRTIVYAVGRSETNDVIISRAGDGTQVARLSGFHIHNLIDMVMSPDSRYLATTSWDHNIVLWDLASGERAKVFRHHREDIMAIAFSQQGGKLVSISQDGTIRVWDVASGEQDYLMPHSMNHVGAIAVNPDGKTVAAVGALKQVLVWRDGKLKDWEIGLGADGELDYVDHLTSVKKDVTSLAFSPRSGRLAIGGQDRLVHIWDIDQRRLVSVLAGHEQPIVTLNFSNDGLRLFSSSSDQTMRVWDPATGREILVLPSDRTSVDHFFVNPGGDLVSMASSNTLRFISAPRPDFADGETIDLDV
ncbi:MAG: WD40 repeat domain-containing protein, partial [Verrucomicrobiota bacterium]